MIKINTLYSLENISDCYFIDDDLNIVNKITAKIKIATLGKRGYYYVTLSTKNNKSKKVYVHKIVALAFINNGPYEVINHIDGNKQNNSIPNLEFCGQKSNITHSWKNNLSRRDERISTITWNNDSKTSDTIKNLVRITNIPKETLYDLFYKKKSSKKYNIKEIN